MLPRKDCLSCVAATLDGFPLHSGSIGHFFFLWHLCAVRSVVSDSEISWTVAHRPPLSMGFSRQGYWSEVPFPPPEHLCHSGMGSKFVTSPLLAGGFFTTCATWAFGEFHLESSLFYYSYYGHFYIL